MGTFKNNAKLNHFFNIEELLEAKRNVNVATKRYTDWEYDSDGTETEKEKELWESVEKATAGYMHIALETIFEGLTWAEAEKLPFCPMCGSEIIGDMGPVRGTDGPYRNTDYFFCDDCGGEITLR